MVWDAVTASFFPHARAYAAMASMLQLVSPVYRRDKWLQCIAHPIPSHPSHPSIPQRWGFCTKWTTTKSVDIFRWFFFDILLPRESQWNKTWSRRVCALYSMTRSKNKFIRLFFILFPHQRRVRDFRCFFAGGGAADPDVSGLFIITFKFATSEARRWSSPLSWTFSVFWPAFPVVPVDGAFLFRLSPGSERTSTAESSPLYPNEASSSSSSPRELTLLSWWSWWAGAGGLGLGSYSILVLWRSFRGKWVFPSSESPLVATAVSSSVLVTTVEPRLLVDASDVADSKRGYAAVKLNGLLASFNSELTAAMEGLTAPVRSSLSEPRLSLDEDRGRGDTDWQGPANGRP